MFRTLGIGAQKRGAYICVLIRSRVIWEGTQAVVTVSCEETDFSGTLLVFGETFFKFIFYFLSCMCYYFKKLNLI